MKRIKLAAGLLALLAILGLGGYYYYQTEKEKNAFGYEIRKLQRELEMQINSSLNIRDSLMLHLISEPFSWAIRQELLIDNVSTIHQYLAQYVKHDEIKMVAVLDVDRQFISCTDKKLEGQSFSDVFPDDDFDDNQFYVIGKENEQFAYHPIMGFDRKLGTLFIIYDGSRSVTIDKILDKKSS